MNNQPDTLSLQERRAILEAEFAPWTPRTMDQLFEYAAEKYADRPYLIAGDREYRYSEVFERACRLADGIAALGIKPGDHVSLLMANYPEYMPLKLAIARAGAVAIPLNYLYRASELAYVLKQSCSKMLITMTSYRDLDYLAMLDEIAPGWTTGKYDLGDLANVVTFAPEGKADGRDGVLDIAELERIGAESAGAATPGSRRADELSDIMYTSGTTGKPKGVMLTHDSLNRCFYGSAYYRGLQDGHRVTFALPCYHMFGYEHGIMAPIFVGGATLPHPRFDPVAYFQAIEKHRVTDMLGVPTMSVALVEHPERAKYDLSSLRMMLTGAAVAPPWLWERTRTDLGIRELVTAYGMTEVGGATVMTAPDAPLSVLTTTVGRPKPSGAAGMPGTGLIADYRIADPITGEELPEGAEGELKSTGPTTMLGYWNRPEETAAVLRDGWMYSGDLGKYLDDGSLVITGRAKEVYKSGGELVMPREIEDFLMSQEGVSQAFVVGIPDDRWGEAGGAAIVVEPGYTIDVDALLDACKAGLARFKVPRYIHVITDDDLPKTASGKVQKFNLIPVIQDAMGLVATATRTLRSIGDQREG